MSEAVPGTFAKRQRDHLRRKRLEDLRGGPPVAGASSGVAARKRFLQRRLIAEVDEHNALIAEIAKFTGPRDETSELEEMAERAQRGLAATFEFVPRKAFPKLLMARIRNSRPKARGLLSGGPGPSEYYVRQEPRCDLRNAGASSLKARDERFEDELGARGRAARAARMKPLTESDRRPVRSSLGRQVSSRAKSTSAMHFEKGPRMARVTGGTAAHVDFANQKSCLGKQAESHKTNPPGYEFPPLPRRNFFAMDAAVEPGPGTYFDPTNAYPRLSEDCRGVHAGVPHAKVLGRVWDQERESTQDAVADSVVGPGSYDIVPSVGLVQRESYRVNQPSAHFSGHVVVQD